jgi:hypothetical protein
VNCNRFSEEVYALHVLGLSEEPERQEIRAHLRENCSTCQNALKDSMALWYLFGVLTTKLQMAEWPGPSPALRRRVLNSVQPVSIWRIFIPVWTWGRVATAGVLAVALAVAVWNIGQVPVRQLLQRTEIDLRDQTRAAQNLEAENRTLRDSLAAVRAPAAPPPAPAPVKADNSPELIRDARQQAEDARNAASTSAQTLRQAQTRIGQLESDLADRTVQLAMVTRNLDDAERRYRDAVQQAAREKERGDRSDVERASDQARIRDLQNQVSMYRQAVDSQQQQLNQYLRMTAMLQSPSVTLVRLKATEAGGNASGVALFTDRSGLLFYAANLPAPPPGRTYQLWLIRDRGPAIASAGTFSSFRADAPAIQFADVRLLTGVRGVAVTEEPAGGSPLPTGHKVLVGTPRS